MRPVPVAITGIVVIVNGVSSISNTSLKLLVLRPYPGVYNVHMHPSTCEVVAVGTIKGQIDLVDPIQPPRGWIGLGSEAAVMGLGIFFACIGWKPGSHSVHLGVFLDCEPGVAHGIRRHFG